MNQLDTRERKILEVLDAAINQESVIPLIDAIALRLDQQLRDKPHDLMAWEVVPLAAYGAELPAEIRSSWVFTLRAGVATGAERHPNSRQRMMSYRGAGDFPIWSGGRWSSNCLVSGFDAPLESRWISIPPNVWHQSMKPPENWTVVSFQTARAEDLIEERGDPETDEPVRARRYLDEKRADDDRQ